jgi:Tfp pilus assembly major pilin PilA
MKLIRKLLYWNCSYSGRKTSGLSTAELVGIIVIVGILGALGGTYVNGLVTQANNNAGNQNATTLNTVTASIFAAGGDGTQGATADPTKGQLDTSSEANCLAVLNTTGVTVNGVTYKMTPPISAAAMATEGTASKSYTMTGGGTSNVVWSFTQGATP